jgi:hypothetical protein
MSRSCDFFYEDLQKHHPRALGFDDVICDLRCSGITVEGLSIEGVNLNLGVCVLCGSADNACWEALRWPIGT